MLDGPMIWQSFFLLLFSVFELACCIAVAIRFRGSVAALLGGLAFGTWFLVGLIRNLLQHAYLSGWIGTDGYWVEWLLWEHGYIFGLVNLVAYGCLLAAIIVVPVNRGTVSTLPRSTPAGPVSKGFYLGSILGGLGVSVFFSVVSLVLTASDEPEMGLAVVGLGLIPMIYGIVVLCVLIYKMWGALEGRGARTTPGKAIGLMFIPIFNFYWLFQVYWGWTRDFNAYIDQRQIDAPRMPEGLALALCILTICSMIPVVGSLLALANFVLMGLLIAKVCDGLNALALADQTAPPE